MQTLDRLGSFFLMLLCLGAFYLFFRGPANNGAQLAFRIGLFVVGGIGMLVVGILKQLPPRK